MPCASVVSICDPDAVQVGFPYEHICNQEEHLAALQHETALTVHKPPLLFSSLSTLALPLLVSPTAPATGCLLPPPPPTVDMLPSCPAIGACRLSLR